MKNNNFIKPLIYCVSGFSFFTHRKKRGLYSKGKIMKNINSQEKSIIGGALSLTISALFVKALGLIYKIPLSYLLSDEGMGYFNSAYTVYTFFYIISTAGVPKAISIMTSEAVGEGNYKKVNSIYKTATRIFLTFGALITVLFALGAGWLSEIIGNSGALFTMIAIAPSIFFISAAGVIRGYFVGRLRFLPIAVSEVISGGAKLVLGLLFAILSHRAGMGLPLISAFTMLGTTLGAALGYLYLLICDKKQNKRDKLGQIERKRGKFNIDIAKALIRISVPITLTAAVGSISSLIDLIVIMRGLGDGGYSELQASILYGNYTTLAVPMLNLIGTLIAPISMVLLPLVSKNSVKFSREAISENISGALKVIMIFAVPVSVLFVFRSYEILSILFEDSSAVMAAPTLIILAPGILAMSLLTVINTTLEGIGKTKIPLLSLLFGSIIKLTVTAILISNGSLGILGAPLGTTISYFASFAFSAIYIAGHERVKLGVWRSIYSILLSSAIALTISSLIKIKLPSGIAFYIFEMSLFILVYLLIMGIINFKSIKRKFFVTKCTKKPKINY